MSIEASADDLEPRRSGAVALTRLTTTDSPVPASAFPSRHRRGPASLSRRSRRYLGLLRVWRFVTSCLHGQVREWGN